MPRVAIFIVFSIFVEFELGTEGGIEPPTSLASAPPTELHRSDLYMCETHVLSSVHTWLIPVHLPRADTTQPAIRNCSA